jgi:excisionase family DNA binding protein
MTEKLLLTIKEAAEALSISERTVRYKIASGELAPAVHIGRSVRIPTASLHALVERLTAEAARAAPAQIELRGAHTTRVG